MATIKYIGFFSFQIPYTPIWKSFNLAIWRFYTFYILYDNPYPEFSWGHFKMLMSDLQFTILAENIKNNSLDSSYSHRSYTTLLTFFYILTLHKLKVEFYNWLEQEHS